MKKLRILLIDNSMYPTGAIRSVLNTAEALKETCTFCFVLPEKSTLADTLRGEGYKVHTLPFLEISKSPAVIGYLPRLWRNAGQLQRIIREEQIDIVHVNDLYNQLGSMLKIRGVRVPVVYHARLLASSYIAAFYGVFARLIKRYADHIIGVSSAVARDIGPARQLSVIYDAVRLHERLPAWDGLQTGGARILYLGNYVRGKGQHHGLEAFAGVHRQFPDATLHFVGGCHSPADEAYKKELAGRAGAAGISDKVLFRGQTQDVEAEMKAADIVLNLSESESFSMVCLEAMSYGVPLVASNCGGPQDITDNGTKAILVPNKDAAAAADGLRSILAAPALYRQQAAASRLWAREKFSLASSAAQLEALYHTLLNSAARN